MALAILAKASPFGSSGRAPMFFQKSDFFKAPGTVADEAERLRRLLASVESDLQRQFEDFIERSTSPEMMAEVSERLERGDVQGALDLIEPHIRRSARPARGSSPMRPAPRRRPSQTRCARPSVSVSSGTWSGRRRSDEAQPTQFVQGLTDQQAVATRSAMANAMETGRGFEASARAFRDSIGLAPDQVSAVANYERLLRANSTMALDRALRDRRSDPSLEHAIDAGEPLPEEKITRMVDAYRRRMLDFRARTIARTESISIMSQAQQATMEQNVASGLIKPDQIEQTWHATIDA